MRPFDLSVAHPSWHDCLQKGISKIEPDYLNHLAQSADWIPEPAKVLNAFSLPIHKVNYVLFGESPYPRKESANGFAFWDASVNELWSETGLSKKVNRATSFRNILKMLLIAEGVIHKNNSSQEVIAALDKKSLVQTNDALFANLLQHGFLLLNATPILQANGKPQKDARAFQPFIRELLDCLLRQRPQVKLILLGRIANLIDNLIPELSVDKLYAEHPYNISFITNQKVIDFFKPLHLLKLNQSL
jgi:uracil-DNA glycosylase